MSQTRWTSGKIEVDNALGGAESFLYFPQNKAYPELPAERLVVKSTANGRDRRLIARTAWATTAEEGDTPLYAHSVTLARLAIRPGQGTDIEYQSARWWHVLFWGDGVRLALTAALLGIQLLGKRRCG